MVRVSPALQQINSVVYLLVFIRASWRRVCGRNMHLMPCASDVRGLTCGRKARTGHVETSVRTGASPLGYMVVLNPAKEFPAGEDSRSPCLPVRIELALFL